MCILFKWSTVKNDGMNKSYGFLSDYWCILDFIRNKKLIFTVKFKFKLYPINI